MSRMEFLKYGSVTTCIARWLAPAVLGTAALASCTTEGTAGDSGGAAATSPSWTDFRANPPVTWEAFRAATHREADAPHRYIVDGDIALATEEALRAHYERWLVQEFLDLPTPSSAERTSTSALTVRNALGADVLWPAALRHALSYCVSNTFGGNHAAVVAAMARATASWTDRAAVDFVYRPDQNAACNNANPNIVFSVEPTTDTSFFGLAFFPDAARADRRLLVSPPAFTTNAGGRDLEGILRHETGHILGFRHEHIWISCTGEATTEARQVTSYDVNSVMHYPQCRPSGAGGYRQSPMDELGASMLYGAPRTTECLFNWAQANYPTLFAPAAATAFTGNYVFRYYATTNAYLGIDVTDQNVYYLPAGGALQNQGPKAGWLTTSNCN